MKVALKSKAIREVMAKKNQSQNGLAVRIGASSGYMSQLMNGTRHPSPELRKKIMAALKIATFDEVFEIVPQSETPQQ